MALPALPPLLTSPMATAPPFAEAVATPPLPAEAVSVNCMMLCPPLCPPKATQPDPGSQCQPVRSWHPSYDPRASYHRLGGMSMGVYETVLVLDAWFTERTHISPGGPKYEPSQADQQRGEVRARSAGSAPTAPSESSRKVRDQDHVTRRLEARHRLES